MNKFFNYMRKAARGAAFAAAAVVICAALLAGCSDDSTDDTTGDTSTAATITGVSISPSQTSAAPGVRVTFQARAAWSNDTTDTNITWSASTGADSIIPGQAGTAELTVPVWMSSGSNIVVTASSTSAPSRFATANVAVIAPGSGNVVTVKIHQSVEAVIAGGGKQYTATVYRDNGATESNVYWAVAPEGAGTLASGTAISTGGYLSVGAGETNTLRITAASMSDSTKYDTTYATIAGQQSAQFAVSPSYIPDTVFTSGQGLAPITVTVTNIGGGDPGLITASSDGRISGMALGSMTPNGRIPNITDTCAFVISLPAPGNLGPGNHESIVTVAGSSQTKTIRVAFEVVTVDSINIERQPDVYVNYGVGEAKSLADIKLDGLKVIARYVGATTRDINVTEEVKADPSSYLSFTGTATDATLKQIGEVPITLTYPKGASASGNKQTINSIYVRSLSERINAVSVGAKTIYLYADEQVASSANTAAGLGNISVPAKVSIILESYGNENRTISPAAKNVSVFQLNTVESTLTLGKNVTLKGFVSSNDPAEMDNSLVVVRNGQLVMQAGSKITGHKTTDSTVSAVKVIGGTFLMDGGTITGNVNAATSLGTGTAPPAAGLRVESGTFVMSGGTIIGNTWAATINGENMSQECDAYSALKGGFTVAGGSIGTLVNGGDFYTSGQTGVTNLVLTASSSSDYARVVLTGKIKSGSTKLHLFENKEKAGYDFSFWYDGVPDPYKASRRIITGANGYNVAVDDTNTFPLGNFICREGMTAIGASYSGWGSSGSGSGSGYEYDPITPGALKTKPSSP